MPTINGRLICCNCGSDLGDAEDPFSDPDCLTCLAASMADELRAEEVWFLNEWQPEGRAN